LWDRYPSLGTIITSEKRGALAVESHQELTDMFTKGLLTKQFKDLTCKLGMIDIYIHQLEGSVV